METSTCEVPSRTSNAIAAKDKHKSPRTGSKRERALRAFDIESPRATSELETGPTPIALAIIDPRTCFRDALATAISTNSASGLNGSVASLASVNELTHASNTYAVDGLLILLGNAGTDEALQQDVATIRSSLTGARIVLLLDAVGERARRLWRGLQPAGLVPSCYSAAQLAACLTVVSRGTRFLAIESVEELLANSAANEQPVVPDSQDDERIRRVAARLTPRQREVMRHVAMGRSNKYIACELDVCESTIKVHVSELMRRLGATSRTHAAWLISHVPEEAGDGER